MGRGGGYRPRRRPRGRSPPHPTSAPAPAPPGTQAPRAAAAGLGIAVAAEPGDRPVTLGSSCATSDHGCGSRPDAEPPGAGAGGGRGPRRPRLLTTVAAAPGHSYGRRTLGMAAAATRGRRARLGTDSRQAEVEGGSGSSWAPAGRQRFLGRRSSKSRERREPALNTLHQPSSHRQGHRKRRTP